MLYRNNFYRTKKDRPRERLGNCQSCSCFPTSPSSQSLNPADSHPDSSGVCTFQSTPITLCLEPVFLRNEFGSQSRQLCPEGLPLLPGHRACPCFLASLDVGVATRLTVGVSEAHSCRACPQRPPRCGHSEHALKKMEPGCKGYCSDNSQS